MYFKLRQTWRPIYFYNTFFSTQTSFAQGFLDKAGQSWNRDRKEVINRREYDPMSFYIKLMVKRLYSSCWRRHRLAYVTVLQDATWRKDLFAIRQSEAFWNWLMTTAARHKRTIGLSKPHRLTSYINGNSNTVYCAESGRAANTQTVHV